MITVVRISAVMAVVLTVGIYMFLQRFAVQLKCPIMSALAWRSKYAMNTSVWTIVQRWPLEEEHRAILLQRERVKAPGDL